MTAQTHAMKVEGRTVVALTQISPGHTAQVVGLGRLPAIQHARLQAYGLVPGRELRVVQQVPVTVVEIEQTELAFEAPIAQAVWVSVAAAPPGPA